MKPRYRLIWDFETEKYQVVIVQPEGMSGRLIYYTLPAGSGWFFRNPDKVNRDTTMLFK